MGKINSDTCSKNKLWQYILPVITNCASLLIHIHCNHFPFLLSNTLRNRSLFLKGKHNRSEHSKAEEVLGNWSKYLHKYFFFLSFEETDKKKTIDSTRVTLWDKVFPVLLIKNIFEKQFFKNHPYLYSLPVHLFIVFLINVLFWNENHIFYKQILFRLPFISFKGRPCSARIWWTRKEKTWGKRRKKIKMYDFIPIFSLSLQTVKPLKEGCDFTLGPKRMNSWPQIGNALIQTHTSSIIALEIQKITFKINCILYKCHLLSYLLQHNNLSLFSGIGLFSLETFPEVFFYILCIIKLTWMSRQWSMADIYF